MTEAVFVAFSAVVSSIKEVKEVIEIAGKRRKFEGKKTILFIDEIHRFNKAQQDAFLPAVENGTVILIGATTENPSFEVISPLLSRCKILTLKPLEKPEITKIVEMAISDPERGLGKENLSFEDGFIESLVNFSQGMPGQL